MAGTIKVTTKWGKKENKTYKIKAKTLGEALKALNKRSEWGKFEGQINYKYKTMDGKISEVTLEPSYSIEMPVWDGYKKAPKACQKEWDRMWKKLEKHEDNHRLIHLELLAKINDWLSNETDLSESDFKKKFQEMADEGQANQDKYDKSSKHGQKEGVSLTISKECE